MVAIGSCSQRPAQPVWCSVTSSTPAAAISRHEGGDDVARAGGDAAGAHVHGDLRLLTALAQLDVGLGLVGQRFELLGGAGDLLGHVRRSSLSATASQAGQRNAVDTSARFRATGSSAYCADLVHTLGLDAVVHVVVDHDHGREAAGAEAAADLERELPVVGGAADVDAELLLEGVQHGDAAAHVAGRAQADADEVLAARARSRRTSRSRPRRRLRCTACAALWAMCLRATSGR